MALYLKKDMLNVVKTAQVTIDLTKLGKVSTNRIAKFLLAGNIQGEAVTAQIARGILNELKEPHIQQTSWRFQWFNLSGQALDEIRTVGSAINLAMPSSNQETKSGSYFGWLTTLMHPEPTGVVATYRIRYAFEYNDELTKPYTEHLKTITVTPSDQVKRIAEGIKARSTKEITITIFTGE